MAYKRKTKTAAELSAACRRAALSRKHRRGGRPKSDPNGGPPKTVKVGGRYYAVLVNCAAANGVAISTVVKALAQMLVEGRAKPIRPHPEWAQAASRDVPRPSVR